MVPVLKTACVLALLSSLALGQKVLQPGNGGTGTGAVPSSGQVPIGNGTVYVNKTITGDATLSSAGSFNVTATHLSAALPINQGGTGTTGGTTGLLTAGTGILGTANSWTASQSFGSGLTGTTGQFSGTVQSTGTNGGISLTEGNGSGLTNAAGVCNVWANSATHLIHINCNNGTNSFDIPVPTSSTDTNNAAVYFATGATVTWTTQPAAVTELLGATTMRQQVDLTNFSQFRIEVGVSTAGATSAALGVQYCLSSCSVSTNWNYLEVSGGTTHEVAISATGSPIVGSWVNIDTPAKTDVQLRVIGVNGDATASPVFRYVTVQLKK